MSARGLWRAGVAVGVALAAVAGAGPAGAHNAGRVELLVTNLQFSPEGQGTGGPVRVSADLVDRDSGQSAGGFAIVVSAVGPNGDQAGPVTLVDPQGRGHYEGVLVLPLGTWTVTAKAEQGMSALPALGSTRRTRVTFDDQGLVATGLGGGGSNLGLWAGLVGAGAVLGLGGLRLVARRGTPSAGEPAGQRA